MTTISCANGKSSVMVKSIWAQWPAGVISSRRFKAPPVSFMLGLPPGRLTTPISLQNTPRRSPVPRAFEHASLAAKRLAYDAARCARLSDFSRSTDVKMRPRKRSPKRSMLLSTRRISMRSEPRPMIMNRYPSAWPHAERAETSFCGNAARIACLVDQRTHVPDRILKTNEDRLADKEVTNVEFSDFGYSRDRFHIVERQTVAGMDFEPNRRSIGSPFAKLVQETVTLRTNRSAISAGMQLHHRCAEGLRRIELQLVRFNEHGHADADRAELTDKRSKTIMLARRIDAAFRRALLALFG